MIFGILAILFVFTIETPSGWYYSDADFWVPFLMFVVPFGVLGLVLGGVASGQAKQVGRKNGFAVAGIATSISSIGLLLLFIVYYVLILGTAFATMDAMFDYEGYYAIKCLLGL